MIPTLHDLDSSVAGITSMSEAMITQNSNQSLTTTNMEIDMANEEKRLLSDEDSQSLNEKISTSNETTMVIGEKQKSLISVYDNSNDSEQQLIQQSSQPQKDTDARSDSSLPLIGIIGHSKRSEAFRKRLIISGFPEPIVCDPNRIEVDPNDSTNYASHETFYQSSTAIVLITDDLSTDVEHLFHQDRSYLIVDAREIRQDQSKTSLKSFLSPVLSIYRAFGNLSNWEIEHGSQRISVSIEQDSPISLIKLISDLNCFTRGIHLVDQYSYIHKQTKSFRYCLFPLVSTIIIFSLCCAISIIEYNYQFQAIYRQASSICAATSLTLLAIVYLIRPKLEIIEWFYSLIQNKDKNRIDIIGRYRFFQRWLQSRRYLVWCSLSFTLLHFIFLFLSRMDIYSTSSVYGVFLGILTLILLLVLSFVFFPWISERLLWREYYLFTAYVGPFCLLLAFIHTFIYWRQEYFKTKKCLFTLNFISLFLPGLVLLVRLIIYGILNPMMKSIHWIQQKSIKKSMNNLTKDPFDLSP